MKTRLFTILLVALCAISSARGQSVRTMGYNASNNQIIAATNLVWTNSFSFSTNAAAAQVRTNLYLGWSALINSSATNFRAAIGLGASNNVEFNTLALGGSGQMTIRGSAGNISFFDGIDSEDVLLIRSDSDPVEINSQWNDPNVRSNLGLPLPALTNTSNVTTMRALSGSTNTNTPFSGSVALTNTNTLVFSNGILQSVQ